MLQQMNYVNRQNKERMIQVKRPIEGWVWFPKSMVEIYLSISIGRYTIDFHLFSVLYKVVLLEISKVRQPLAKMTMKVLKQGVKFVQIYLFSIYLSLPKFISTYNQTSLPQTARPVSNLWCGQQYCRMSNIRQNKNAKRR